MTDNAVALTDLTEYLDAYLRVADVPDYANAVNGLQVANTGTIHRVVAAVDASQATIDRVAEEDRASGRHGSLLLVHHGLFWDGQAPLTGRRYRRAKALLEHDVALYGAHLPLDVHPEVGNNAVLARRLQLGAGGSFGDYHGTALGVWGTLELSRDALVQRLNTLLKTTAHLIPGGPDRTRRVGIITGGAGSLIDQAHAAGLDTFVTGEGAHHTHFDAMEWGLNVIYAGHYATETVGVQALAEHLGRRFGLPWVFHDHPTGL